MLRPRSQDATCAERAAISPKRLSSPSYAALPARGSTSQVLFGFAVRVLGYTGDRAMRISSWLTCPYDMAKNE